VRDGGLDLAGDGGRVGSATVLAAPAGRVRTRRVAGGCRPAGRPAA